MFPAPVVAIGDTFEVEIAGMTGDGDGLAAVEGTAVHVFAAAPGEVVLARSLRQRRGYLFAETVSVTEACTHRATIRCKYFGACTGCQWQHLEYAYQLHLKSERVKACLVGEGLEAGLVRDTLGMGQPWHYRNHARLTVDRAGRVGFVHRETRRRVAVGRCEIMHPWVNTAISLLQGKCAGHTQISIRYGAKTGDWLVQPKLDVAGFPFASGQPFYRESLSGRNFRVSSPSFFQVNSAMSETLAAVVSDYVGSHRDVVVDAYAGVGTFAALLADQCGKVLAIEESAAAVRDARENLSGLANVTLIQAKVEDVLSTIPEKADALILDPPRSGCQIEVLDAIGRDRPSVVVYVSCEPASLARDLAKLAVCGFDVVEVQPVDMFPQTRQVECVAWLRDAR